VAATTAGYQQLLALATQQPGQRIWAIESTAGYGAGLTRFLHASAEQVVELDRPKRAARRHGAKSDPLDATRAAREALGREHLAQPRAAGHRAALQVQLTARRSAVQATGDAQRQLHALVTAAQNPSAVASPTWPPPAGHRLPAATPTHQLGHRNHRHRGQPARPGPPHPAPGHRDRPAHPGHHHPGPGLATRAAHPNWRGPDRGRISAVRLVPCWPRRSDAAFAMLGGAAPIPASSGQTMRYRLNRSGDRQLNQALHVVVMTRLRTDPATRAYAQRRRAQGKTNREIKRCLVRYVARQLYRLLETPPALDAT
jgi:transposase